MKHKLRKEIIMSKWRMQRWEEQIEEYQREIKSREESFHHLEKEEEEGVLYHYSSKLSQTKRTINYVSY